MGDLPDLFMFFFFFFSPNQPKVKSQTPVKPSFFFLSHADTNSVTVSHHSLILSPDARSPPLSQLAFQSLSHSPASALCSLPLSDLSPSLCSSLSLSQQFVGRVDSCNKKFWEYSSSFHRGIKLTKYTSTLWL